MGSIISYFILLSPITIIYCPGLTELCHFPFKIQILQETILSDRVGQYIEKGVE